MHAWGAISFDNLLCIGVDADQAFGVADLGAQDNEAVFVGVEGSALGGFAGIGCVGVDCVWVEVVEYGSGLCAVGVYKAGVAGFDGEDDGDVGQQVVSVVAHDHAEQLSRLGVGLGDLVGAHVSVDFGHGPLLGAGGKGEVFT